MRRLQLAHNLYFTAFTFPVSLSKYQSDRRGKGLHVALKFQIKSTFKQPTASGRKDAAFIK